LTSATVLVIGLLLSTTAAVFAFRAFDADESQRFAEAVSEIQVTLQARLDYFANSIRQLAAVYALNPRLKQYEFTNFTSSTGIRANDAGIFSYGIFRRAKGPSLDKDRYFIDLRELGPHAPPVVAPLGREVTDNADRVNLCRLAMDSATTVIGTHVASLTPGTVSGQMMVAPAFEGNIVPTSVELRRKKAIGFAYARFSEAGLFDQVLQNSGSYKAHLDIEVYDGTINKVFLETLKPLYIRTKPNEPRSFPRSAMFELHVGGRPFAVRVLSSHSQIWSTAAFIAVLILALGIAASLAAFRVIRLRERRSERLVNSERQLKLVTDALPVMIAYIDDSYTYRFNNKVYEDVLGLPRSEITDHKVQDILSNVYDSLFPQLKRAMSGERVEHDWTVKLDGGTKHYHQVLLPDFNHRGEVKGVVAMHTDVTERVKAQANAEFLEEISSILATSLDPVLISEMLTKKLLAVCDWCVIELSDEDGVIDRHMWAASTPERYEKLKSYYTEYPPKAAPQRLTNRARETRKTQYVPRVSDEALGAWSIDSRRRQRSIEVGFKSIVVVPLVNQDHLLGTIAFYSGDESHIYTPRDVEYFEEIALRSSLAFENARLYAQSQNLNRAKDHFLAMLSHELRTPMNVILGWLEILTTEDVDDETYAQAMDTLNRNAKVQIQLINDLLDVSRIINGKLSLHATKTNVGFMTVGAVDSVQPATRAKNIQTSIHTEGDLTAFVDSERIQQVLWNLLSNAVKFTPSGGRIEVRVVGDPRSVTITVTDTGQGIDEKFLPYVFDRFRQEENSLTRSQGGLGLGLSIVRYIVEGHGGTIQVSSEGRNRGTTFTVVLPKVAQIAEDIHFTAPEL